jgi:hypothetical protein
VSCGAIPHRDQQCTALGYLHANEGQRAPTPRLPFSVHMVRSRGLERRLAKRTELADYFFETIPSNGAPSGVAGLKQVKFSVEPLREDSFEYCNRAIGLDHRCD